MILQQGADKSIAQAAADERFRHAVAVIPARSPAAMLSTAGLYLLRTLLNLEEEKVCVTRFPCQCSASRRQWEPV